MLKKLKNVLIALVLALLIFVGISLPATLFVYFSAWLLSFGFNISLTTWTTHFVIWAIGAVWTIGALNTKEGGELAATVITGKR